MIETRTVFVDGAELAVHCTGEGPLAVLVHGYPLDHRMWLDTLRSPLAQQRTLCAIDLRGHGRSPWAGDAAHSMERFADDVAAVARTLADGPIDLVGLSMGGYVALAFAERHADLLYSLALVDTKATADTEAGKKARRAAAENVMIRGRRWLAEDMRGKLLAETASPTLHARVQTMIESTPFETILADLEGLRERPDRLAVLANTNVPVLAVVGREDALTPVADTEVMAKAAARSTLCVVPGAGHLVPMEQPAVFVDALGSFWRTDGRRA